MELAGICQVHSLLYLSNSTFKEYATHALHSLSTRITYTTLDAPLKLPPTHGHALRTDAPRIATLSDPSTPLPPSLIHSAEPTMHRSRAAPFHTLKYIRHTSPVVASVHDMHCLIGCQVRYPSLSSSAKQAALLSQRVPSRLPFSLSGSQVGCPSLSAGPK